MDLDNTYMITASVVVNDTEIGQRSRPVPTFYVVAVSEDNARAIAKDILEASGDGNIHSIWMAVQCMADITIGYTSKRCADCTAGIKHLHHSVKA